MMTSWAWDSLSPAAVMRMSFDFERRSSIVRQPARPMPLRTPPVSCAMSASTLPL